MIIQSIPSPLKVCAPEGLSLSPIGNCHPSAWIQVLFLYGEEWRYREREMFYLTTDSTHFIYGYMVSDIWLRTILLVRKETRCRHIGYSFRLAAMVLLYAPSHRQDSTYHILCYTSRGALAGTRNSSMGPPHEGSIRRPIAPWANVLCKDRREWLGCLRDSLAYFPVLVLLFHYLEEPQASLSSLSQVLFALNKNCTFSTCNGPYTEVSFIH